MSTAVYEDAASYEAIVGEDTSGRLPALVLGGVINARRQSLGLERAAMRFVSGRAIDPLPPNFMPEPTARKARALIVSEYICSGTSVMTVYEGLAEPDLWDPAAMDIAAVDAESFGLRHVKKQVRKGSRVLIADLAHGNASSYLYGDQVRYEKGIEKGNGPCFSRKQPKHAHRPARVAKARADIKVVVGSFVRTLENA